MADNEEFTVEGIRISELPVTSKVDKDADYIPLAHTDAISVSDNITYKVTPAQLLSDVGLSYEAGDHIDITDNVISATYDAATVAAAGLMSSADKTKLDGIESGANNYTLPVATTETLGGVKAGNNVVIENDGTLNAQQQIYTAGTNVDITNNVISATDTTYDPATTSTAGLMSSSDKAKLDGIESGANYYVLPAASANAIGGVKQGQNVTIAADGTLDATNTTYSPATTSVDGLMSATDKTKLDGIEAGANNYSLPIASSAILGGVKQGNNITIDPDGTINATGGGGGSSALASLTDVNLSSPTTGQALIYDGTSAKWVNGNGGSGASTLAGLTDVTVASAANGQVLTYDSASSEWKNAAPTGATTVGTLTDVTLTALNNGQILRYDSTAAQWVNSNETTPSTPALGNLTNVTLTSPTDGQALIYDNANSEWVNGAVDYSKISGTPNLATVATSGDYSDLTNTPTIPDGLSDLTDDVAISSPTDGQILKYDGTSSKWINGTGGGGGASALDDLTDVDITNPTANQVLKYDGTSWVNGTGGGSGAEYVELTQSEYDVLTPAEKKNGTMYFITDTNGDGQDFQPIIYSIEEREIGVWTDGKPLYKKTYVFETELILISNTWTYTDIPNTGIDKIISFEALNNSGTNLGFLGVNRDSYVTGTIGILNTRNIDTPCKTFTIQYTKTTDTPGSGTWTPQGVPAVHYSTDEQIVGTWIDGSTIYEKTFDIRANAETISDTLFADLQISKIIDLYLMLYAGYVFQKSLNISYNTNTNKLTIKEGTKYVQFITVRYIKSDIQ